MLSKIIISQFEINTVLKEIIFINSHPIQYFAPLYKFMNKHGLKTKVWYCSNPSTSGGLDLEFGLQFNWDIPLLKGYDYQFFTNQSWKPSHFNGFFGLINIGMVWKLFWIPKSVIVVHGFHYLTHFLILLLAGLRGHKVCLRLETPLIHEQFKHGLKKLFRRKVLKYIIFSRVNYFLYIGSQNRLFYKSLGIPDKKLVFCPYSVDNERFGKECEQLKSKISKIKGELGIPVDHKVILFSGKFIHKKNPLDLIKAFHHLNCNKCWLIMLGEGKLRTKIENYITKFNLKQVLLTGFINQSRISEFYAISDVFVMASSNGETWGLSVNEALNFNLPIIVSDLTGCSEDLVKEGDNGYRYQTGNIEELTSKLKKVLIEGRLKPSTYLKSILDKYSYTSVTDSLKHIA